MIKVSVFKKICNYMSIIFYYGVFHQYSFDYIEERISNSGFIAELEKSDEDFLYNKNITTLLQEVYEVEDIELDALSDTNSLFLWLGEAYTRLFYKTHKCFSYLFLYIPLKKMIDLYDLYHEQDWTQLYRYFWEISEKTSLLKMLVKKRGLSINKLSLLTGISQNTLNYYALDDSHLYEAKYIYIDSLSHVLNVSTKIFLPRIHNYLDTSDYDFDRSNKEFRSYLGLYIVSFFANDIQKRGYIYDKKKNVFASSKSFLMVVSTESNGYSEETDGINPEIDRIVKQLSTDKSSEEKKNTILVIFEHNMISQSAKAYSHYKDYGFERIYIINKECLLAVKEDYWKSYLPKNVDDLLKEKVKADIGDFSV